MELTVTPLFWYTTFVTIEIVYLIKEKMTNAVKEKNIHIRWINIILEHLHYFFLFIVWPFSINKITSLFPIALSKDFLRIISWDICVTETTVSKFTEITYRVKFTVNKWRRKHTPRSIRFPPFLHHLWSFLLFTLSFNNYTKIFFTKVELLVLIFLAKRGPCFCISIHRQSYLVPYETSQMHTSWPQHHN